LQRFKAILQNNSAILTLVSGTALAQAVTFMASPVLSRMYAPTDFGEIAIYLFCLSAVQVVACARYEMAIVLAKTDEEAHQVIGLSWLLVCFFSLIALVFAIFYQFFLPKWSEYPHLAAWFWWMPFAVFGLGTYMIFNQALIRKGDFGAMSSARFIQSISNNGLQILLGYLKIGATGLFVGSLVSNILYGTALFVLFWRKAADFYKNWSLAAMLLVAKKYESLPRTTFFQSLIEMYQANALSFLLPLWFGAATGGFYFRTLIIFQAPVSLLGQALAQVNYKTIADLHQNGQPIQPYLRTTMRKAALLMLPVSIGLLLFGPFAFRLLFGEQWHDAGVYARILSVWMYFDFIRVTIVQVCIIIKKQKQLLLFSIIGAFLLFFSLYLAYLYTNNAVQSLVCLSATMTVFTIALLVWLDRLVANK
jgi:O-antigen/teichoic acid export membrane protein